MIFYIRKNIFFTRFLPYNEEETQGGICMPEKLRITSKHLRGVDGYKTFSIRIREETLEQINKISDQTGRSRNELIGILLDFSLKNCEVV